MTYFLKTSTLSDEILNAIRFWLNSEIGGANWGWIIASYSVIFYFKHEEDKVKFILRWV